MKKIELRKIQMLQLEAFKEADRICKKYGIKYYMIGGTLIGAVRHKGFIPWDYDMDIAMMRKDYDRFLSLSLSELDSKFFLQNYRTDPEFNEALTRICIIGTYQYDKYTDHLKYNKGTYIDIQPIDNVPDDDKKMKKHQKKINIINKLILYKCCIVYRRGPLFIKLIAKKILRLLLYPVPLRYLQIQREKAMKEYCNQETSRVSIIAGRHGYEKQVMPRSVYGEPVLLEFEGRMYYAPNNWDAYLKQTYGEYMTFPPLDMRKPIFDVFEI